MGEMERWIEERLFELLGLSQRSIVDYLVGVAQHSRGPEDVLDAFSKADIPLDERIRRFAEELHERYTPISPSPLKRSLAAKVEIRHSDASPSDAPQEFSGKKKMRALRKHETAADDDWAPDTESPAVEDAEKREIEEFEERLRERDRESTRSLVADHSSRPAELFEAMQVDILNDPEARRKLLPELRERSRQEYLVKRVEQQVELKRRGIQDEEILFKDTPLTEAEIARLERDREVLRLTEERKKIREDEERYHMPDNYLDEYGRLDKQRREAALYARYKERQGEKPPATEQDQWEQNQIEKAVNPQAAQAKTEEELLIDIDYVLGETTSGQDMLPKPAVIDVAAAKAMNMLETRKSLPIFGYRDQLLQAIRDYQVLIIVGETGSGKTTQIPQYLLEAGYTDHAKRIGCTQPRRVAAMSVAARVADELSTRLGHDVGYSIRFEDCTTERTKIKYMTDGMLLREFLADPALSTYSVLMIDEAHERTLQTDILFGLMKDISRHRTDLKLLISSATLDADRFSDYFDGAPIFTIPGRRYPVDILYTKAPEADYLAATLATIMNIHLTQPPGDILVFLTGQEEIETMQENLMQLTRKLGTRAKELKIAPIYASLPSEMQAAIFEPTPLGARKVVLATNIAETSITIDGISYVIDPGFCKQNTYNPRTGMESLVISKASANQRAGRAGRIGPGKCFRVYTAWAFQNELEDNTIPEIQRTNLANTLGIENLAQFDFMDPPAPDTMMRAVELLYALGALNQNGALTKLGRRMAEFPMDPMMAKTLLASEKYACSEEIASIIAMLSIQGTIFYRPKDKSMIADNMRKALFQPGGDHLTLLNIWNQWVESSFSKQWCFENFIQLRSMKRARDIRDQIVGLLDRAEVEVKSNASDTAAIRKAIAAGYFYNAARLQKSGDSYRSVKTSQAVFIHPSSSLYGQHPPKWVIYFELVYTSKEFMRQVVEIQPEWLLEVAPHYYRASELDELDRTMGKKLMRQTGRATGTLQ